MQANILVMNIHKHSSNISFAHGFTLIELMVTMVLSLFLMAGAILMYQSVKSTYDDVERMSRMQENIRFASDYLVRDVRNAGFSDEISLTLGEERTIEEGYVELSNSGSELRVRYAGRGHCEDEFETYQVVQNRYWLDAGSGELRCTGSTYDPDTETFDDSGAGMALVGGLTGLSFELEMANGDRTSVDTVCNEFDITLALGARCLGVHVGMEFEAMRDMDSPGESERRFVELFANFRNPAINHIYSNLYD